MEKRTEQISVSQAEPNYVKAPTKTGPAKPQRAPSLAQSSENLRVSTTSPWVREEKEVERKKEWRKHQKATGGWDPSIWSHVRISARLKEIDSTGWNLRRSSIANLMKSTVRKIKTTMLKWLRRWDLFIYLFIWWQNIHIYIYIYIYIYGYIYI